jgi:cell division protein FtsB
VPDNRRTPARGARPRGRTGPGRTPTGSGGARAGRPAAPEAVDPATVDARRRTPRLTGRAGILVLVLAVLTVSYASSLRAYLQQRSDIAELKTQIDEREATISSLEREKRRWQDPAYVQAQAHARFGYLMPGQTSYVVLDENGKPLESESTLTDPATIAPKEPTAWWSEAWRSVELAGHPPAPQPPPATRIDGSKDGSGGSAG